MDGLIYTVVETVKKLENTLRNCFEDKNNLTFQLTGQSMLPGIPRIAPKMEYKLNINKYGDVVFILENFNKHKNVFYRMHLRDGIEEIYKEQTATDEVKIKINGLNNIYIQSCTFWILL
jgi:5'-3' exonuclease